MGNTIRLVADVLPPYHYLSSSYKTVGLNYEIIKKALEISGYNLDMETKESMDKDSKFKKIDGIVKMKENNDSVEDGNLSDLIIISKVEFISNNPDLNLSKLEEIEIKNLKLGFVENYEYAQVTKVIPKDLKIQYKSYDELIEDIYCNNIDLGLIDLRVESYIKNKDKNRYKSIKTIPNLKFNAYFHISFMDKNIHLKNNFNIGLKKLIDTNQYSEIVKYWSKKQDLSET